VAGSLASHAHAWLELGASQWLLEVVRSGFSLLWGCDRPARAQSPVQFPLPRLPGAVEALDQEVSSLVAKGAVECVVQSHSPGFYSRLFVVPKKNGKLRPVLDLSPLNTFLRKMAFKMETPALVRQCLRQGDFATSIDLADAYFHVGIHPASRSWLRFVWKGQTFQFRVLPFGLSQSPWVFTKVVSFLVRCVRAQGVRIIAYLDDWLIMAQSVELCSQHTQVVLHKAAVLGFRVNLEKSDLSPSRRFLFLGMQLDTETWSVAPSAERVGGLQGLLQALLAKRDTSARVLYAVLGRMESMALLLPLARLHKRPLQAQLAARWNQATGDWEDRIPLFPWFREAVSRWLDPVWIRSCVPISLGPPLAEVFADASLEGWGAHWQDRMVSGVWSAGQDLHINLLEMEAVRLALEFFAPDLPRGHIQVVSDNMSVVASINNQGGARSRSLTRQVVVILLWAQSQGFLLSARHLAGRLNVLADLLSRNSGVIQTEWTLTHRSLSPLWESWGRPAIDLFATRFNNRLPLFVSPVEDPRAWAVDALTFPWTGLSAYAFPPIALIHRVLLKARLERPRLILVAPHWPARPWFPLLLELSSAPPIPIPIEEGDLFQPRSLISHGNPGMLHLHGWLLYGDSCIQRGSPMGLSL
jgi:hypothetical protein